MKLVIDETIYEVIDTKEKITIADSFVLRANKIGRGNGEAKLYIGQEGKDARDFFGSDGFGLRCFLLREDLDKYLNDTEVEYLHPEQNYTAKLQMPHLWLERKQKLSQLPEVIEFEVSEQTQIEGPRLYISSKDQAYQLIRELSLPNITYITIVKLYNEQEGLRYYFRLFADFFGDEVHPFIESQGVNDIMKSTNTQERIALSKARIGQGEFRLKVLEECPICPITLVADDRILIASHIKPWAVCNAEEKLDPKNGFMFTPNVDKLFDKGFLSFTEDKRTILSPFLSKLTYSRLGISDDKEYPMLPIEGREKYLQYHRENILK